MTSDNQNPFEALTGGGGFDMNALLQQAQQMQEHLAAAQQKLNDTVVEGTAGGGVTVKVTGAGDLVSVDITPGSVDPGDPDALADLGDLVVAAYRDAKAQADKLAADSIAPLTGGGLPGMPDPGKLGF